MRRSLASPSALLLLSVIVVSFVDLHGAPAFALDPSQITAAAHDLADAADSETKYGQDASGQTHCSEFVRDLVQNLLQQTRADMQGQAKDQYDALTSNTADWAALDFSDNQQAVFAQAQQLANEGTLVVVAWKKPLPEAGNTGHIAVVVPGTVEHSATWNGDVPMIAQAGKKNARDQADEANKSAFAKLKLSWGFTPTEGATGMEFFKYTH